MFQIVGVGYSCVDKICTVEDFPVEDSSTHIISKVTQGGGAVATALVAISRLGVRCAFIGNIGNDKVSDEVIQLFEADGVSTEYMVKRDDCHGLESYVMVNPANGSRTKFPERDYNPPIAWDSRLENAIRKAQILHLDGTHYENALNAAKIAKSHGVLVSLDGCSMQKDNEKNCALASMADILIMNSKYPLRVSEKDSYEEALLEMSTWGPRIVGCTLGEDGSRFVINGKVRSFPSYKAQRVVDTTGCGDVFHGAFLNSYLSGMDLEHCIRFASITVSIKCNMPGGRAGIPNKEQVLKLMVEKLHKCRKGDKK